MADELAEHQAAVPVAAQFFHDLCEGAQLGAADRRFVQHQPWVARGLTQAGDFCQYLKSLFGACVR